MTMPDLHREYEERTETEMTVEISSSLKPWMKVAKRVASSLETMARNYGTMVSAQMELMEISRRQASNSDMATLATLRAAGLMDVWWDEQGELQAAPLDPNGSRIGAEPPTAYQEGLVSVHGGGLAWVFQLPAPYTAPAIVCSPDETQVTGMRCYAERKLPGGERQKIDVIWKERNE